MSLSSYSCNAFTPEGTSTSSDFLCGDFRVQVYKTWAYILDKYHKCCMTFREGHLTIMDTELYAETDSEGGFYLAVYRYTGELSLLALGVYTGDEGISGYQLDFLFEEFQTRARKKVPGLPEFKYPYGAIPYGA
jgi:hypothetical protein